MKLNLTLLMGAILLLLGFFTAASSRMPSPPAPSPLKLAVIAPLSGDFARFGLEITRGAQLAVEALRREGISAEIVAEDACLAADVLRSLKNLINTRHIDGIAGSYCVIGMAAIAPLLNQHRLVSFHTSPISDDILKSGGYLFSTNVSIQQEASKLADFAFEGRGARRAALLGLATPWGQDYMRYFQERFEELGGTVISAQDAPIGENDFRAELLRAREGKPDIIFAAHISSALGNILKQARALGISQPFIGTDESEDDSVITSAGPAAEGFEYLLPGPRSQSGAPEEMAANWRLEYGGPPPHSIGTNAYDATLLLGETLASCHRDPDCARSKLLAVHDYPGASGLLTLSERGSALKAFTIKEIRNGKFVRL